MFIHNFFVCIWNIFQFLLGILTTIYFGFVTKVFRLVCFKRFFILQNVCLFCFFLSIWNIFQFLGVLTIIFFVFRIVCFKCFFNPKNLCMFWFRNCLNFFSWVVDSAKVKTVLKAYNGEPRSFYNLILMLEQIMNQIIEKRIKNKEIWGQVIRNPWNYCLWNCSFSKQWLKNVKSSKSLRSGKTTSSAKIRRSSEWIN